MLQQYNVWFVCKNVKCENHEKEIGPVHSDTFKLEQTIRNKPYKVINEKGVIVEGHGYYTIQSICPICQVQMEEGREEETDEIVNPALHFDLTYCSEDRKKGPGYYTRFHNRHGGKDSFNPVTETGGKGGGRTL